jgi:hypothetical protein
MLSEIYKKCMRIGYWLNLKWGDDEDVSNWSASTEWATVVKAIYYLSITFDYSVELIMDNVMDMALDSETIFRGNPEDHGWDDYCRGFLAGQIFGMPTTENIKLAEKAEELWNADDGTRYGYYQEVLEEIREDNWTGVRLV